MSTSDPHERTGAAIPTSPGHRASPGPNPDDINQGQEHEGHGDEGPSAHDDPDAPAASPTTPGPDPDDLRDR
ncbi:hypothetical protein [Cellulomonas sp. C5510]|uniref:hypothetical protein n=1 Tax=Cellulomonas sp. C5510 TaxID=2871170 RepID=UPI001C96E25A|nr:hypothetical protein [Cellulomonas sp. C5510]QZN85517.1 hypothetical protein K5O09_17510 [Cellulomonas sp. C5510]